MLRQCHSPLWIQVTVACFQSEGFLELTRQMVHMVVRIRPNGSTHRQLVDVMRSTSGAVFLARLSCEMVMSGNVSKILFLH